MIAADAPPSFDAHREEIYATIHSAAPFLACSSGSTRTTRHRPPDIVCDLCTEMPKPTNDGKTYTFKIPDGVRFTDGNSLA
jgi:peptide/nickel transport system substrate-binding protein